MKNTTLAAILLAFLFSSCENGTSRYEKIVADAVQTRNGTKYDLNFKVKEISHHSVITVADSIRYLREEFEAKNANDIAFAEESLKAYEMIAGIGNDAATNLRITGVKSRIDSLRNARFATPEHYTAMNEGKVLVNVIRCTYTIDIPGKTGKMTAEETFDFFISPDGKHLYGKKIVK